MQVAVWDLLREHLKYLEVSLIPFYGAQDFCFLLFLTSLPLSWQGKLPQGVKPFGTGGIAGVWSSRMRSWV